MPKHTYNVELDNQTFTRTTARTYTHLVVAKISVSHRTNDVASEDSKYLYRERWEFYTDPSQRVPQEKRDAFDGRDLTCEQYVQYTVDLHLANIEKKRAEGFYDKWIVIGWCGRHDLASKLASKTDSDPYFTDTRILTVN